MKESSSFSMDNLRCDRVTEKKMKFSIKNFLNKFEQNRRELRIYSHLLNGRLDGILQSLIEDFIFWALSYRRASVSRSEGEMSINAVNFRDL